MTDILKEVKEMMGITGDYQDGKIQKYIDEAKAYLIAGGVPEALLDLEMSVGIISRGADDLWTSADRSLSPYFYQRAGQLAYEIASGKYIVFYKNDYGIKYRVPLPEELLEGSMAKFSYIDSEIVFPCEMNDYIEISLTKEQSEAIVKGEYEWSLKIDDGSSVRTIIADGKMIVR